MSIAHQLSHRRLTAIALLAMAVAANRRADAQVSTPPPTAPVALSADAPLLRMLAKRVKSSPKIDGALDDDAWQSAIPFSNFRQVEPNAGAPASFETVVRVVYDSEALYIAAFCRDSMGARGVRVQDLRRKFDYFQNDLFGVSIDALHDGRTVAAFQTTPFGAQRELQAFDDAFYNREWEAVWRVRTTISDSGWTAEIAIPWATLRYRTDGVPWNVNFYRIARRANETSAWSPWPRALTAYRVAHFGQLAGLEPPPPRTGIRVRPYLLGSLDRAPALPSDDRGTALSGANAARARVGGEITWTPTTNAVVDVTVNTDFAQAEVDRQVINTSRFSVFFPERRQFFLEGATLFDVGPSSFVVKPFFSRRIGLDDAGTPVQLLGGVRYIRRDAKGGDGVIVLRQSATASGEDEKVAATYGVIRTTRNVGSRARFGALAATRLAGDDRNVVGALDGFAQLGTAGRIDGMVSAQSASPGRGVGFAATASTFYSSNTLRGGIDAALVTRDYAPPTGFVSGSDLLVVKPTVGYDWRPGWLPKAVRYLYPYVGTTVYTTLSSGTLRETFEEAYIDIFFQNGALLYPDVQHSYQRLDAPFQPVRGVTVAAGTYSSWRGMFYARSDQSRAVSSAVELSTGGYFDRTLDHGAVTVRAAPSPRVALSASWDANHFRHAANGDRAVTTHLIAPEARFALNPRVQLTTFYQYNTNAARGALNLRLSWEFAPMSYVYFVTNDVRAQGPDAQLFGPRRPTQQAVLKLVWLRQM